MSIIWGNSNDRKLTKAKKIIQIDFRMDEMILLFKDCR
jgi:hypothetical protein